MEQYSGTQAVQERQRFDVGALDAWLRGRLPDFAGGLQVEQFKGGQSNPTFLLSDAQGHRWVMRAKPGPKSSLLPSAHAIEREYRVMDALSKAGFPAPRVHLLNEDESVIGRAFYVMQMVEGRVLWDPSLPGMTREQRAAHYDEMNRVLAQLHTIDPKTVGLESFGKPGNYFARQIDRWTKQYRLSETQRIDTMERLIEWLPANIPPGDDTSIVHGDYRLDNMIFHPTEPRVMAVLDWELSTLGHPLADFSYHCMAWRNPPEARGVLGRPLAELGIPSEDEYKAAYCRRTGRSDLPNWNFYLAYNLFRSAGIAQGIAKRVLDGTAASAHATAEGTKVQKFAERSWAFVEAVMQEQR